MAKGRWNRYARANKYVLDVLRKRQHLTTNGVRKALETDFNFFVSWQTASKYLDDLFDAGHVEKFVFEKNNTVCVWKLKQN